MEHKKKVSAAEFIRIVGKAFGISLKVRSPLSLIIGFVGFVMAFWPVITSRRLAALTDGAVALSQGKGDLNKTIWIFCILALMLVFKAVYTAMGNYLSAVDSQKITRTIRTMIIKHSCRVKFKYIENHDDFKQKIDFAKTEAGSRVGASIQSILAIVQGFITVISIAIALWQVNVWLLLILVLSCVPTVIISNHFQDAEYTQKTKWMTEGVMVMHLFSNGFRPWRMKEIRCFGLYDYIKDVWKTKARIYQKARHQLRGKYLGFNIFADVLRNGVFIGALLIAGWEIYQNPAVGLGVFMLIFSLSGQFQDVVTNISVKTVRFFEDVTYMRDFFELDHLEKEPFDKNAPVLDKLDIVCDNVAFAYPGADRNAINGLSVKIKQGEKIAIVGENGSGKSTFVNMLLGFFEPSEGSITVDGEELQSRLTSVRRSISAVFQEFGHYDNTIRENICISDRKRKADDAELTALAQKTGAYEYIKTQPDQFDEMIGSFSKTGNNLSGGQWQKLALTRALYKNKAKMIILDEPTAALDPIAEANLYRDFAALTGDKTTILISHRLGITSVVDRILVFSEGKIVEDGSHEDLMQKNGVYAEMYQAQAQWYR